MPSTTFSDASLLTEHAHTFFHAGAVKMAAGAAIAVYDAVFSTRRCRYSQRAPCYAAAFRVRVFLLRCRPLESLPAIIWADENTGVSRQAVVVIYEFYGLSRIHMICYRAYT